MSSYTETEVKDILKPFMGKQTQIPPKYSALKHEGETLYRITRDNLVSKEELDNILKEKSREIEIYNIKVLDILYKENILRLEVFCSSGTYIRTLVEDIAEKAFNTVATVYELHRTSVGNFNIEDSYKLTDVLEVVNNNNKFNNGNLSDYLLDIENVFSKFPKTRIEESRIYYFKNGVRITNKVKDGLYRVYSFKKDNIDDEKNDVFVGLGLVEEKLMKREYIYEE